MGTKCLIAVIDHEGDGHYIRCAVDGYPEWVGRLLLTYYPTRQKALDVIGMGDFSSLGKSLEPKLEPTIADEDCDRHRGIGSAFSGLGQRLDGGAVLEIYREVSSSLTRSSRTAIVTTAMRM